MDDPNQASAYTALRYIVSLGGLWLATHGYIKDANVNDFVSAVMIVAPIIWGVVQNYINARKKKADTALAVQSGINLVVSGQAVTTAGQPIKVASDTTIPPLPVTPESAAAIIKNFAPSQPVSVGKTG